VRYESPDGNGAVVLANELRLPANCMVELRLRTTDVIHSFWVPALAGKVDMIPGRENRLLIDARHEGVYRAQCAEYCGTQHARMALEVIVTSPEAFRQWLAREARPAAEPSDSLRGRGRDLFLAGGCGTCHTIRGTGASGTLGPDLTHVGNRRTLAAGTLRNHVGTMAAWIVGAQTLKPGSLMPSMPVYSGEELQAVAAYLSGLE
jgi:cytochrome c oxidase subunit 2